MLREWLSIARSAAWQKSCATADVSRLRADVADAFVDRAPIAWAPVLHRSQSSDDRALFEQFRRLDHLRRDAGRAEPENGVRSSTLFFVRLVLALAAVQIACGFCALAIAGAGGQTVVYRTPQIVLAIGFTAAGLLLGATTSRDHRSLFPLTIFATIASAFARAALAGPDGLSSMRCAALFSGLVPEAFAPAVLWQFALAFPRVSRFTRFDRIARRVAAAVWLVCGLIFVVNAAIAHHVIDRGALRALERDDSGNAFWHLFTLMFLPAVGVILVRSRRANPDERRRVLRFATSIAVGTGPFLVCGIVRLLLPRVDEWFLAAASPARVSADRLIIGALTAMPVLATMALIVDRPFERQPAILKSMIGGVPRLLAAAHGTVRADSLERRLTSALEQMRLVRGRRELGILLRRELKRGVDAAAARVLVPHRDPGGRMIAFVDPFHDTAALASDSSLIAMCGATSLPLDLSPDGPLLALVPEADREWATAGSVALMARLRARDGSIAAVVLLGARRCGRRFGRRDRWFVSALAAGAAAAWAALGPDDAGDTGSRHARHFATAGEAAFECDRCGLIMEPVLPACRCGGRAALASLPQIVAGTFIVARRIGAGGMGVVYLARDTVLDREVALKTLPSLEDAAAARLHDEARAMAALNHESLATIYGLEFWRRTPILVVEYFPEGTLARRLARGPLPPETALALGVRLARALSYMHARGAAHRDLKPSNIGLTTAGIPKLLDFGLATLSPRAVSSGISLDDDLTVATFAGTSAYQPPEARVGAPADPSVDRWALSVVVLEALIGWNPFRQGTGGRVFDRAEPLDFGDVPLSPDRRRQLAAFFERALAFQPQQRFSTSAELQSALESLADCPRVRT